MKYTVHIIIIKKDNFNMPQVKNYKDT